MQAQRARLVEPQLMVGAQHAAVIAVDVEALVDGDTRGVGLPAVPDRDVGTVIPEGPGGEDSTSEPSACTLGRRKTCTLPDSKGNATCTEGWPDAGSSLAE